MVINAPFEMLFNVSEVFDYNWQDKPHSFDTVCSSCGEMVVEKNARVKAGNIICLPCSEYEKNNLSGRGITPPQLKFYGI